MPSEKAIYLFLAEQMRVVSRYYFCAHLLPGWKNHVPGGDAEPRNHIALTRELNLQC